MMAKGSFFIQTPEDAQRHIGMLVKGLKKVAIAGWVGGVGCLILAVLLGRFLMNPNPRSAGASGFQQMPEITFVAWFMAAALLVFSTLYFVSAVGLAHQQKWARYAAAGTFLLKVLLCLWLGRGSALGMVIFLGIALWDFYGLWVLLSKEAGHWFASSQATQHRVKPANLVT